jgi:transposase
MEAGLSKTKAVEKAMHLLYNRNKRAFQRILTHYHATRTLLDLSEGAHPRGQDAVAHPRHINKLSIAYMITIDTIIADSNATGYRITLDDIRYKLAHMYNIYASVDLVRRMLHRQKYKYCHRRARAFVPDDLQRSRMLTHISRYSDALREQERGECVIVYTDESYVHRHHHSNYYWQGPIGTPSGSVATRESRGERFILLHAITKDGLLHNSDHASVVNLTAEQRANPYHKCATAEIIMRDTTDGEGNYHDTMNGDVYMAWLENRLLPAFNVRYGVEMRMVLVLDNARYHQARGPDFINPNSMSKPECAEFLAHHIITQFTMLRNNVEHLFKLNFYARKHTLNTPYPIPTLDELRQAVRNHIVTLPIEQRPRTRLAAIMQEHNHATLFTPPYTFATQPIEMLWSYAKEYVAHLFRNDRTLNDVYSQMLEGYYGAPARDAMAPHMHANLVIPSYIEHTHKYLLQCLQSYGIACTAIFDFHRGDLPIIDVPIDDAIEQHQDAEQDVDDALIFIEQLQN